jgi:hypothetical protein
MSTIQPVFDRFATRPMTASIKSPFVAPHAVDSLPESSLSITLNHTSVNPRPIPHLNMARLRRLPARPRPSLPPLPQHRPRPARHPLPLLLRTQHCLDSCWHPPKPPHERRHPLPHRPCFSLLVRRAR